MTPLEPSQILELKLILIGVLEKKVQLLPYLRLQIVQDFSTELDKHGNPNPNPNNPST